MGSFFNLKSHLLILLMSILISNFLISCSGGGGNEEKISAEAYSLKVVDEEGNLVSPVILSIAEDKNSNGIFENSETKKYYSTNGVFSEISTTNEYNKQVTIESPSYIPIYKYLRKDESIPSIFILEKKKEATVETDGNSTKVSTDNVEISIPKEVGDISSADVGYYDPSKITENMPGDFSASFNGDSILSSAGAFDVNFYDKNGAPIELPKGKDYQIKFKVSKENYHSLSDFDDTTETVEVPLWDFDTKQNKWVYAGIGTVVDSEGNPIKKDELLKIQQGEEEKDVYVVGNIKHFSFINIDFPNKRGAICGKIEGYSPQKGDTIHVWGVDGTFHSSATINKDGSFCLPTPIDKLKKGNPKCECPRIATENWFKLFKKLHEEYSYAENEECEKAYDGFLDAILIYSSSWETAFKRIALKYHFKKEDKDTLDKLFKIFEKAIIHGQYDIAFNSLMNIEKLYGSILGNIPAEQFLKVERDLLKKNLDTAISGLLGVTFDGFFLDKEQNIKFGDLAASTMGFISLVDDAVLKKMPACEALPLEILNNAIKGAYTSAGQDFTKEVLVEDLLQGKPPNLERYFKAQEKITIDQATTFQAIVDTIIDKDNVEFNPNFINCLRDVSNYLKNNKNFKKVGELAGKFVKGLEKQPRFLNPKAAATAIASAQIVATGIQIWFDQQEAMGKIKNKELMNTIDSEIRAIMRDIGHLFKEYIPEECLTDDIKKALVPDPSSLPACCSLTKIAVAEMISNLYSQSLINSQKLISSLQNEEKPNIGLLVDLSDIIIRLTKYVITLESLVGTSSPYTEWVNYETGETLNLDAEQLETASFSGGHLFQLILNRNGINIPLTNNFSINPQFFFTPGIESGSQNIAAYIGSVNMPIIGLEKVKLIISFTGKDYKVSKIDTLFLTGGFGLTHTKIDLTDKCSLKEHEIECEFPINKRVMALDFKLTFAGLLENNGKEYKVNGNLTEIRIKKITNLEFNVYEREIPKISSVSIPDQIKPKDTFKVKFDVTVEKYPTLKEIGNIKEYKVLLKSFVIGKGNQPEIAVIIPDKKVLSKIGNKANIFAQVCYGNVCDTYKKEVEIILENKSPVITEINIPEIIDVDTNETIFSAKAEDKDNDTLSYLWKVPPYLKPEESNIGAKKKFKVIHPKGNDIKANICVYVSDGLNTVSKCKEVTIKAIPEKPYIKSITYSLLSKVVPAVATFRIDAYPKESISKIYADINSDKIADYTFSDINKVTIQFEKEGSYSVGFWVVDNKGNKSDLYNVAIILYKGLNLSVSPSGKVEKIEDSNVNVYLTLNLSEIENKDLITEYKWDINGDGKYEYITTEPELNVSLSKDEINQISKINVEISTLYQDINYSFNFAENIEPYLSLETNPKEGKVPLTVNFKVYAYKPKTEVERIYYDFDGDGNIDLETDSNEIQHTYEKSGTYNPEIKVKFKDGTTYSLTTTIEVKSTGYITSINIPILSASKASFFYDKESEQAIAFIFEKTEPSTNKYLPYLVLTDRDFNLIRAVELDYLNQAFLDLGAVEQFPYIYGNGNNYFITYKLFDNKGRYSCLTVFDSTLTPVDYNSVCIPSLEFSKKIISVNNSLISLSYSNWQITKYAYENNILSIEKNYRPNKAIRSITTDGTFIYILSYNFVAKLDSNFNIIWKKRIGIGGEAFYPYDIRYYDSKIYITLEYGSGCFQPAIIILNSETGELITSKKIGDANDCSLHLKVEDFYFENDRLFLIRNAYLLGKIGSSIISAPLGIENIDWMFDTNFGNLCPKGSYNCERNMREISSSNNELKVFGFVYYSNLFDASDQGLKLIEISLDKNVGYIDACSDYLKKTDYTPQDLSSETIVEDYEGDITFEEIPFEVKTFNFTTTNINLTKNTICGNNP